MKKALLFLVFILFILQPCHAQSHYHIEALQIGNAQVYNIAYDGLLDGLARQNLVKGYNLTINRMIIETKPNPTLWERLKTHIQIRKIVSWVRKERPDLVITIGTLATETFQEDIAKAGIPVVFTSVSTTGPHDPNGITGVTISPHPSDVLKATLLALPNIKCLGIIHGTDNEAIAYVNEVKQCAYTLRVNVISQEVNKTQSIVPAAQELIASGIDAFIVPVDGYYELKASKAYRDLITISHNNKVPCVSSIVGTAKGTLLSLYPDFGVVGDLTADHISTILKNRVMPHEVAVINHRAQNFIVDLNTSKFLGIHFRPYSVNLLSLNN